MLVHRLHSEQIREKYSPNSKKIASVLVERHPEWRTRTKSGTLKAFRQPYRAQLEPPKDRSTSINGNQTKFLDKIVHLGS